MKKLFQLTSDQDYYYIKEYGSLKYDSPSMKKFLSEIYKKIIKNINIKKNNSLLDIGCGRGYFLRYLNEKGYHNIKGIDPCQRLIEKKLFNNISKGSFEKNSFKNNQFTVVFTCHTLHHLKEKEPLNAVKEMFRIARDYVVIVEINNTNLPMFLISLLNWRVEKNAFRYNRVKTGHLLKKAGGKIIYNADLKVPYISGNSFFYRLLAKIGAPPYNLIIAKKRIN